MGTATFFEDIEFGGRNKVRDIVFEDEESFMTRTITLDYVQFLFLSLIKKQIRNKTMLICFPYRRSKSPFKMRVSFVKNKLNNLKNKCR